MINHKIYALILNEEIINIIVAENQDIADLCAKEIDQVRAISVECTDYRCSIGDFYIDGTFYFKDRKTVIENTSLENRLNKLEEDNKTLKAAFDKLNIHFSDLNNSTDSAMEKILNFENALCDLSILVTKE